MGETERCPARQSAAKNPTQNQHGGEEPGYQKETQNQPRHNTQTRPPFSEGLKRHLHEMIEVCRHEIPLIVRSCLPERRVIGNLNLPTATLVEAVGGVAQIFNLP